MSQKKCRYQTRPEIHTDTRNNVTINNNDELIFQKAYEIDDLNAIRIFCQ
ncbi:hypothetical protein ACVXZ0_08405 [Staphylococcus aureus]